jgi:glutamyl/glutaminyl-tRNA synthetase
MGIEGVVLSTSQMRLGINEGTYTGWDDIRLGTLRALARRGISQEAVKNAVLAIGIGDTDISFSWDNLYAENKKIVDPVANRYFFVPDPLTAQSLAHNPICPRDAHLAMLTSRPPPAFEGRCCCWNSLQVTMVRLRTSSM